MKMHKMRIAILSLLLPPALLWSQQVSQAPVQSTRAQRMATAQAQALPMPERDRVVKIFPLQYQDAEGLARIISVLIPNNEATARIIVTFCRATISGYRYWSIGATASISIVFAPVSTATALK